MDYACSVFIVSFFCLFLWHLCVQQEKTGDVSVRAAESSESNHHSAAVREKLAQLEAEIQKFRTENASLAKLRKEQEQVSSNVSPAVRQ